jgi:hypothetical protein
VSKFHDALHTVQHEYERLDKITERETVPTNAALDEGRPSDRLTDEALQEIKDGHFGDSDVRRLVEEVVALRATGAQLTGRLFPIQNGPAIPWSIIAPFEYQAKRNHDQSLERLAERGGLSSREALCVLNSQSLRELFTGPKIPDKEAGDMLLKRVAELAQLLRPVAPDVSKP